MANKKDNGNTMAEYGLLLGTCAILALGGLMMLSQSVHDLFGQASSAADKMLSNNMGLGAGSKMLGGTVAPPVVRLERTPDPLADTTDVSDHSLLNGASSVATNVSSVDGSGMVLGSTKALQKLTRSIQNDPGHDPTVLALVTALAKDGHAAANSMAEALVPNSPHPGGGATLYANQMTNTVSAATSFKSNSDKLTDYLLEHPNALRPETASAITNASQEAIGVMGSLVNFDQPDGRKINNNGWIDYANGASSSVHHDANMICRNGGDTDACMK